MADVVTEFKDAVLDLIRSIKTNTQASAVNTQAQIVQLEPSLFKPDVDKLVEGMKDKVSEVAKKAGEELGKLGSKAMETGRTLASGVAERSGQAFSAIGRGAGNAAGAVGRFAGALRGFSIQAAIATVRTLAMAAAERVAAVAKRIGAAAQTLLNIAMRLNPLGLIITGIMLLVGLIVLAYQRSATFRAIVQAAMRAAGIAVGALVDVFKFVVNWVKANWQLLLGILTGPIGLAVTFIVGHWNQIKAGAAAVKDFIVGTWNALMGFFGGLPGRLSSIASQMWEGFKSAARGAVNFLIDAWNSLDFGIHVHLPSWLGGMGFDIDDVIPDIPRLAEGGLVPRRPGGVLALLGEGRDDELVLPLSRVPALAARGQPVSVNVYPRAAQSEYEIGRVVARELAWAAKH